MGYSRFMNQTPESSAPCPYVLDPQIVDSLRTLNPDDDGALFREIVSLYLQDATAQIAAIRTAAAIGDVTGAVRAAHSLRGSSGNFGATWLATLAQQSETEIRAGRLEAVSALLSEIDAAFARVRETVEGLVRTDGEEPKAPQPPASHE